MLLRVADAFVRLSSRPLFITMSLNTRTTALHAAALTGNVGVVKLLLERAADPSSRSHSHSLGMS